MSRTLPDLSSRPWSSKDSSQSMDAMYDEFFHETPTSPCNDTFAQLSEFFSDHPESIGNYEHHSMVMNDKDLMLL